MRGLQGSFSRLKSRLTSNKQNRHHLILSVVLLHNFRIEHVVLNQIQSVFSNPNSPHINLEGAASCLLLTIRPCQLSILNYYKGYDRIAHYFDVF